MSIIGDDVTGLPRPNFEYITTEAEARRALAYIDRYPTIAIDTETTGLDPYEAKWSLLQIGSEDKSFVFDVRYDTEHSSINPKIFTGLFTDSSKNKLLQNAAYDMKIIKHNTGVYLNNIYDTMLAEQLLGLGLSFTRANLAAIVEKYLGITMPKEPRGTFVDYNQRFEDYQIVYAANDVTVLHLIKDLQMDKVVSEGLSNVLDLESRFLVPLCEMELNGIQINTDRWRLIMKEAEEERDVLKFQIQEIMDRLCPQTSLFGVSLTNIDSNQQLKKALSNMGLELDNVDSKALEVYKGLPVIDALLGYRKANKLISTYAEPLLERINPVTGRLHTSFKQMVSTGRLSSNNPNLQNIPRKQKYRSCFVAKEGYSLVTADMSGAELRILGNLSKDPIFVEAYATGQDLHTRTAAEIFGVSYDAVKKDMRNAAKSINFGLCYGMSAVGLAARLGIKKKEAEKMIAKYFDRYKGIKKYLDRAAKDAVTNRYTPTISGRKRYYSVPPYDHPDRKRIQASIERQGMNAGIQGCLGADTFVKSVGLIEGQVGNSFIIETGFGTDKAVGVYSGEKELYNLTLSNGITLDITLDHKIPVLNKNSATEEMIDKEVRDLDDNDLLLMPLNINEGKATDLSGYKYTKGHWRETFTDYKCPKEMNEELSFIIGCLIGDGTYTKHNHFRFVCPRNQEELFDKFNRFVKSQFGYEPKIKMAHTNDESRQPLPFSEVDSVVIRGFLKHIGLEYVKHEDKSIPKCFYTETIANRGALLNGLFSTDGSAKTAPSFTTISKDLAQGIHKLLFTFGINSNLKTYMQGKRVVYRLQVFKRFNNVFTKYVGFSVKRKQDAINESGCTPPFGDTSIVPRFIPITIEKALKRYPEIMRKFTPAQRSHLVQFKKGYSSFNSWRKFYSFLPECSEKKQLSSYLNFDFCLIKSLTFDRVDKAYDIMCDSIHYFTANGVICHNSNADTIKESLVVLYDRLKGYDARIVLSVHDEIIVEVRDDQKHEVANIVSGSLVDGFGKYFSTIPMETEALIGKSWLKGLCEKCHCNEMSFVEGGKYGTRLVCSKCGEDQE